MTAIQLWDVYFIANCRLAKPLPKDKYVAICCFAPNPCGFFINSRINEFIQQNPKLLDRETPLTAALHSFLQHDSWLDCRELLSLREDELTDCRGRLDAAIVPAVLDAVQKCPVLRPGLKKLILGA